MQMMDLPPLARRHSHLFQRHAYSFLPAIEARDVGPTPVKRVPETATTVTSATTSCVSNQSQNSCQKPTSISSTLPIALGVTVPIVAILVFIYLHRQYKNRLRQEDRADAEKYKSMDFGMDLNYGTNKKGKKGGETDSVRSGKAHTAKQLSLDPSTALYFPGANPDAHQSTDSLLDMDHRYRPVALAGQDGMSIRSASPRPTLRGRTDTMNSSGLRYDSGMFPRGESRGPRTDSRSGLRSDSRTGPLPPSKDSYDLQTPKPALTKDSLGVPLNDTQRDSYFEKNANDFRKSNNYLAAFFGSASEPQKPELNREKMDEEKSEDSVSHINSLASTTFDSPTNKTPVTSISDVDSLPPMPPTRKNSVGMEIKTAPLPEPPKQHQPYAMVNHMQMEPTGSFAESRIAPVQTDKFDFSLPGPPAHRTELNNGSFSDPRMAPVETDKYDFPLPSPPAHRTEFTNSVFSETSNLTDILNTPRESTQRPIQPSGPVRPPRGDSLVVPFPADEPDPEPLRFTDEPGRFTDDPVPEPLRFTDSPAPEPESFRFDHQQEEPLRFHDQPEHEHEHQHHEQLDFTKQPQEPLGFDDEPEFHDVMDIADEYGNPEHFGDEHLDEHYHEHHDGQLDAPQQDNHRLSVLMRPLPPDDPNENPEERANRIRSFYKEYFDPDEHRPDGAHQPPPQSSADYYEDYGSEYLNNGGAVYDAESQGFVVAAPPFAQPVTRRAMTPPPRGPPRFHGHGGPGMMTPRGARSRAGSMANAGPPGFGGPGGPRGPPRGPSQMSNYNYPPPGFPPRGPSAMSGYMTPRGPSQMSNYSRGPSRMKKPVPPPQPLMSLPTPHLLKDDTAIFGAADFAPPVSFRERQQGKRPDSPMGMQRPYSPSVRAFNPLVSSFDELGAIPSPHQLRKSGSFTNLDFAPPRRFKNDDGGSDVASMRSGRSGRSGISALQAHNIRNGAYRISKMPKGLVGTKADIVNELKPNWDLR